MYQRYNQFFIPNNGFRNIIPRSFNWNSFLTNAGKTLNVINQAIPVFYQVKPVFNNLKTMFRVANEIKNIDKNDVNNNVNNDMELKNPIFFK